MVSIKKTKTVGYSKSVPALDRFLLIMSTREEEPQLRNCFHKIGLWPWLCRLFWFMIDLWEASSLWEVALSCIRKLANRGQESKPVRKVYPWSLLQLLSWTPASSFCSDLSPSWMRKCKAKLILSSLELLLTSVLSQQQESNIGVPKVLLLITFQCVHLVSIFYVLRNWNRHSYHWCPKMQSGWFLELSSPLQGAKPVWFPFLTSMRHSSTSDFLDLGSAAFLLHVNVPMYNLSYQR